MCCSMNRPHACINESILAKSKTELDDDKAWFHKENACILQSALLNALNSRHQSAFFIDLN